MQLSQAKKTIAFVKKNYQSIKKSPDMIKTCSRSPNKDKAPRLSIRIDIWILLSDTETSAATPPGVMQKK